MARRTGISTLRILARKMCAILSRYGPVIRLLYPDMTDLIAALDLAEAACQALTEAIENNFPMTH